MVDDVSAIRISVTLATFALVTGDTVDANLPIGAYHVDTIVHVYVASFPFEATWTLADKFTPRSRYQRAVPVVVARICCASVVLPLAIFIHEVFRAVTYVSVDSIDASAAILTGLGQTLVHVDLAIFTFPFRWASAIESVFVARASAPVAARIIGAIIDGAIRGIAHVSGITHALRPVRVLHADAVRGASRVLAQTSKLAVPAGVSGRAIAVIRADVVHAIAAMFARIRQALVQVQLAVLPLETIRAVAYVTAVIVVAHAVVQARISQAFVYVHLAIRTFVSSPVAYARIIINTIDTNTAVPARIRGALVDIRFAIFSTPSRLAIAFIFGLGHR